jgi:membrane fusion protein (multidrug efflux system)
MRRLTGLGALGALVLVLVAIGALKFSQIATLIRSAKAARREGPPPETVATATARAERWELTLAAVGNVAAVRGVTVSTEVAGRVESLSFRSGTRVDAGAVLAELDASVERGQLAAAKSQMDLAFATLQRSKRLVQSEAISKLQLDQDQAAYESAAANHRALQATVRRKVVRAPFAGRLGIRQVNLGQYLAEGTPIVVIESLGAVYLDFSLPQRNLGDVHLGTKARARLGNGDELVGTVAAIDPDVDLITRSVRLRASVPDEQGLLRPGMFVQVEAVLAEQQDVVTAPVTAVIHAPYGDSVFIVENHKVRQQFVRLGAHRGDFVAFKAGVKEGQELVTEGGFKLHNGDRVLVDNTVQRKPSLRPDVENR